MAALVRVQPACIQVTRTANIGTTATGQRRLLAQRCGQREVVKGEGAWALQICQPLSF